MSKSYPVEKLIYWINEREAVRKAKEEGLPPPWSKDKTMQVTYFCNVHREDDRVTRWIRQQYSANVLLPSFTANICMARLVNRISSLEALGYMGKFNERKFRRVARGVPGTGKARPPFWGNAYVVTTHGQKMSKVDYAVGVLAPLWKAKLRKDLEYVTHLVTAHEIISQYEGFGSFMAAQVVADLKNTPGHPLQAAPDWHVWAASGPGSMRGLGWCYERKVGVAEFDDCIALLWAQVQPRVPAMCMQDFQNCLCEFDKYMRVSTGAGRSKRKYPGAKV